MRDSHLFWAFKERLPEKEIYELKPEGQKNVNQIRTVCVCMLGVRAGKMFQVEGTENAKAPM